MSVTGVVEVVEVEAGRSNAYLPTPCLLLACHLGVLLLYFLLPLGLLTRRLRHLDDSPFLLHGQPDLLLVLVLLPLPTQLEGQRPGRLLVPEEASRVVAQLLRRESTEDARHDRHTRQQIRRGVGRGWRTR